MTVLIRLCRHLTGLRLVPSGARLTHRRSNQGGSELVAYFGGHITFGARADELTFAGSPTVMSLMMRPLSLNQIDTRFGYGAGALGVLHRTSIQVGSSPECGNP